MCKPEVLNSSLIDALDCGIIVLDKAAQVCLWNRWVERHTSILQAHALGKPLWLALQGEIDPRLGFVIREALDLGMPALLSYALHPTPLPLFNEFEKKQRIRQSILVSPMLAADAQRYCLIRINDISSLFRREQLLRQQSLRLSQQVEALTQAQEQLQRSEFRFKELARQAPIGMFETNTEGVIQYANENCLALMGLSKNDCYGQHWTLFVAQDDQQAVLEAWANAKQHKMGFASELRFLQPHLTHPIWIRVDMTPIRLSGGHISGFIGTCLNIHDAKEAALRDARMAHFDSLTQLHNRAYFNTLLERAILMCQRQQRTMAILFIDLNDFKPINDNYGHDAGDEVLCAVSRRLKRVLRPDDTLARFGGDEFVIMLNQLRHLEDVMLVKKKVIRALAQPINIRVQHVQISCSIGVAVYPEHGDDASSLMRHADLEMYRDKQTHKPMMVS